jgi:predicted lipid-binding transport protein (Tim44 family)
MPNVKSPAYVQKVGSAVQKIPGNGIVSKGLGFIGKGASKVAPFLLPLEAYTRIDNGESPYRVGASMVGGLAVGAIGSLAGTFTAGPFGSVAGGLGGYIAGEKLAEKLFDSSNIGNKINQQSIEASNNKSEVNNINLPPQQVSQPAPSTPQPQTSSPSVSDVPSCDRSLPETLDCKF